jgi:hypothetical protein
MFLANMIIINTIQFGMQMLAHLAKIGTGADEDEDWEKNLFCMYNGEEFYFDMKTPFTSVDGSQFYINTNMYRETKDVFDFFKAFPFGMVEYLSRHMRIGLPQAIEFFRGRDFQGNPIHEDSLTIGENFHNLSMWAARSSMPPFLKVRGTPKEKVALGVGSFFGLRARRQRPEYQAGGFWTPEEMHKARRDRTAFGLREEAMRKKLRFKTTDELLILMQRGDISAQKVLNELERRDPTMAQLKLFKEALTARRKNIFGK